MTAVPCSFRGSRLTALLETLLLSILNYDSAVASAATVPSVAKSVALDAPPPKSIPSKYCIFIPFSVNSAAYSFRR